jgi:hypothetical protein
VKDRQITRWYKDHLQEFEQPVDGMRIATFKVNSKQIQVPVPDDLWLYCLDCYTRMNELRRFVMERVLKEI